MCFPITEVDGTSVDFFTESHTFRKVRASPSTMSEAKMSFLSVPLFVYGSLKRGFAHHQLLKRALRLGEARVLGCGLVMLDDYPALISPSRGLVHGELYRVDRPLLGELDEFEECPDLYRRKLVRLANGGWAFAYFAGDEKGVYPPVRGGKFIE